MHNYDFDYFGLGKLRDFICLPPFYQKFLSESYKYAYFCNRWVKCNKNRHLNANFEENASPATLLAQIWSKNVIIDSKTLKNIDILLIILPEYFKSTTKLLING